MISSPRSPLSIKGLRIKREFLSNHIIVKPQWFDGADWSDFVFFRKPVEVKLVMPKLHGNYLPVGNKVERAEAQVKQWLQRWVIKSLPGRNMAIQTEEQKTPVKETKKKVSKPDEEEAPRDTPETDIAEDDNRPETPSELWSSAQGID